VCQNRRSSGPGSGQDFRFPFFPSSSLPSSSWIFFPNFLEKNSSSVFFASSSLLIPDSSGDGLPRWVGDCLKAADMSKKLPRCGSCGRSFRPDKYNKGRQVNCTYSVCVRARKQLRQRNWQARRRADDRQFRLKGNARCAEANRRRRENARAKAETAKRNEAAAEDAQSRLEMLWDTFAGLVAQLTDTSDPVRVEEATRAYAARGRRLSAVVLPSGPVRDRPVFLDVTRHPLQAETGVLLDTRSPPPRQ